jgi:hypothetical protein
VCVRCLFALTFKMRLICERVRQSLTLMVACTCGRRYAPPKKEKAEPVSIGIGDRVVVDGTLGGTLR